MFRPNASEGKKGRFFVPAGVAVDGVKMQSYLSVHAADSGGGGGGGSDVSAGGLLSSIKLSSKRGLDVQAATDAVRRALAALPPPPPPGGGGPQMLTLQLHLERFRLRFKPSLPERGEESLAMEFLPCLARRKTAAEMGQWDVPLSAPPPGSRGKAAASSISSSSAAAAAAAGAVSEDAGADGSSESAGGAGAGSAGADGVESMDVADTEDELLTTRAPLQLEPEPEPEPEVPELARLQSDGEAEFSRRYGDHYVGEVFCGGHLELTLAIDAAAAAAAAADDDADADADADGGDGGGDDSDGGDLRCSVVSGEMMHRSGGLILEDVLDALLSDDHATGAAAAAAAAAAAGDGDDDGGGAACTGFHAAQDANVPTADDPGTYGAAYADDELTGQPQPPLAQPDEERASVVGGGGGGGGRLGLGVVLGAVSDWYASILRFNDPVPVRLVLAGWQGLLPAEHSNQPLESLMPPSPLEPPLSRLPPLAPGCVLLCPCASASGCPALPCLTLPFLVLPGLRCLALACLAWFTLPACACVCACSLLTLPTCLPACLSVCTHTQRRPSGSINAPFTRRRRAISPTHKHRPA